MKKLLFVFSLMFFTFLYIAAQSTTFNGPVGSVEFGKQIVVLSNGNYVVTDPNFSEGGINAIGAVYLYNGSTNTIISTLKGSSLNDGVGQGGIVALSNGNFVVITPYWNLNPGVQQVGAVTWGSGTTGVSGIVSGSNSLTGTKTSDNVGGGGVVALTNGNYVVGSTNWGNGAASAAGAVTWCNGAAATIGTVSIANSLVGSTQNDFIGRADALISSGGGITALTNGNYVVPSAYWNNGAVVDAGAVTWGNGNGGTVGVISSSNSMVGSHTGDMVGDRGIIALNNGNYVSATPFWANGNGAVLSAGAVTWGNGATGTFGIVGNTNSLTGSKANDQVGLALGVTALTNGNYVVASGFWDNGAIVNVGAVTWCDGTTGLSGPVSAANSIIGSTANDRVGNKAITNYTNGSVVALSNGNYVISSGFWDNGAIADAGAVTWCNGTAPTVGVVSTLNSLVGSKASDNVGSPVVTALTNGNYVVGSQNWDNGALVNVGAATWCDGSVGRVGVVSTANSLVGVKALDSISSSGITPLANGNYVVRSSKCDNGAIKNAGAATWGDGAAGTVGTVTISNSLMGSKANDNVSNDYEGLNGYDYSKGLGVVALTNGNYVVSSFNWDNGSIADAGAATWGNGITGTSGTISSANSLVGNSPSDLVGYNGYSDVIALSNGDYLVRSDYWDNGALVDAGAVTAGIGSSGTSGFISTCNSVLGQSTLNDMTYAYNPVYDEIIIGRHLESKITLFSYSTLALALSLDNASVNVYGNSPTSIIASTACRLIAKLTPNGAAPLASSVAAKVWIETTQPANIVKRHYELAPQTSPNTATEKVTLYALQQEFDDFNAVNTVKLPTGPSDVSGIANLYIEKHDGVTGDGSGLPGSYVGNVVAINPADADIIWNAALARWEISFNSTGLGGLFIKTSTPLPLTLLSFSAALDHDAGVEVWKTTNEINTSRFDVERSIDGRNFTKAGTVLSLNQQGEHVYQFTDPGITSLKTAVVYYRLKQTDNNGGSTYSQIVPLRLPHTNSISIYPNPTKGHIHILADNPGLLNTTMVIIDISGKTIKRFKINSSSPELDVSDLSGGVYILKFEDGSVVKLIKE